VGAFDKQREVLEKWFKDRFVSPTIPAPVPPVQWENVPFDEPESRTWVRLSIRYGDSFRRTLGANPFRRHLGVVFVQVFVPAKGGSKAARVIADQVADILQEAAVDASPHGWIELLDSSVRAVGIVQNGCYQMTVATPFQHDE
jgi:hypothetical protein